MSHRSDPTLVRTHRRPVYQGLSRWASLRGVGFVVPMAVRIKILVCMALVAMAGASAVPAGAERSYPQMTDARGDSRVPGVNDIVSGQFATTGSTAYVKSHGKRIAKYTPKNLVATLTFTAPPSMAPATRISFIADITACNHGFMRFDYAPHVALHVSSLWVWGCGTDSAVGQGKFIEGVEPVVKDRTITWTMPLSKMGKDLPLGTVFSNFRASSDIDDPLIGDVGTDFFSGRYSIDAAHADVAWILG